MITGKVDGKTVNWQFDTQYEGQTLTVYYTGTSQWPRRSPAASTCSR